MEVQRSAIQRTLFPWDHSNFTRSVLPVYRVRMVHYAYTGIYCNAFSIIRTVLTERKIWPNATVLSRVKNAASDVVAAQFNNIGYVPIINWYELYVAVNIDPNM